MPDYDLGMTRKVVFDGNQLEEMTLDGSTIWEKSGLPEYDKINFHSDFENPSCYSGSGTSVNSLDAILDLDGTVTNGPTFNSTSPKHFDFDGSNDFIHYDNNTTVDVDSEGFTVSCWFKSDSNHNGIVFSADKYPERMFQIKKKSNGTFGPVFQTGGSSSTNQNRFTSGWSNNVWYHCVSSMSVFSNAKGTASVKVYRNNSAVVNNTITINMANASPDLCIGRQRDNSSTNPFNGKIAQVIMWETTLTSTEVGTIWNLQKGAFGY